MLYSFFFYKNAGCSSAFRLRYPNIYYRTFLFAVACVSRCVILSEPKDRLGDCTASAV